MTTEHRSDFTTKRHPRSQVEAFGPYGDQGPIHDPYEKPRWYSALWWVVMVIVCLAAVGAIAVSGATP